jgi:hypothetical protein
MKSVGGMEVHEILIELKYCERCGGLWLRLQGANAVYCAGCQVVVEARRNPALAPPFKPRPHRWRDQRTDKRRADFHSSGRIDCLQGVATIEVRA